jgi:hypothetical protein
MEKEIFKDIKGYEGLYQISNLGRVKSFNKKIKHMSGYRLIKEKFIKPHLGKNGYYAIDLKNNTKREKYTIHRLIAIHFILNLENKPQVNHINGIKTDNSIENLEWVTNLENAKHAYKTGLIKLGERSNLSKLTDKQVLEIKERLKNKESHELIAKSYNVHRTSISKINQNKTRQYL